MPEESKSEQEVTNSTTDPISTMQILRENSQDIPNNITVVDIVELLPEIQRTPISKKF